MITSIYYHHQTNKSKKEAIGRIKPRDQIHIEHELELDELELNLIQDSGLADLEHFDVGSEARILKIVDPATSREMAYKAPHFYIGEYILKYWGIEDDFSEVILWFKNIRLSVFIKL